MISKDQFLSTFLGNIDSFSGIDRSRILFAASTIVIITLSSIFFLSYDLFLGYPSSLWVYTFFIAVFGFALYLLKIARFDSGITLLLLALNLFIYLIMSSIPEDSMSAIFYIGIIVLEYVLLGHEKKTRLFAMFALSLSLYFIDSFVDFSLLPMRSYDQATLQVNKVIDFVICAAVIVFTIKLLIDYLQAIISERTRTNAELKRLNGELDKYAYTITHDVKGPIQSMQSLMDIMENDRDNMDQYLRLMGQSFQKLSGLIEDVAERARNRNFEVVNEEFDLKECVENIWDLLKYSDDAKGVELTVEIPNNLEIKSDKGRISGILNNLITNAIRYHDKRKENPFVSVSGSIEGQQLSLIVQDNGLGIENKHKQKVFEMFFRASNKEGGSGLGLFTVKEIVDSLDGSISLESELGEGTSIKIEIPIIF